VQTWKIEYASGDFERFYLKLPPYEQAVVDAALMSVLAVRGIAAFDGGWGKSLGGSLFEFRIQRSLDAILSRTDSAPSVSGDTARRVSISIFCTFAGDRIIVLFHGYDKGRDPSTRRQQAEIAKARTALRTWRRNPPHGADL
jgi:hypothetical protein